jgi:hypothetical protein
MLLPPARFVSFGLASQTLVRAGKPHIPPEHYGQCRLNFVKIYNKNIDNMEI